MAEPVRQDYPRSEIIEHHAEFQQLLLDMAKRSAGGKPTSGRYKKYDSTRLLFLNTIAFPSLRLGKRIDPKGRNNLPKTYSSTPSAKSKSMLRAPSRLTWR